MGEYAGLPALDVANHSNPVPDVRRHLPWYHVDLLDISVGEHAGLPALDVANHSNPIPDVRDTCLGIMWTCRIYQWVSMLPALDVENHSNPVSDVRRHLLGDHVKAVSLTLSQERLYIFCSMARSNEESPWSYPYFHPCPTRAHT